jgi:hypothetical protein
MIYICIERGLFGTESRRRRNEAWLTEHSGNVESRCRRHQGALKGNWEKEKWLAYRTRVNMSGCEETGVRLNRAEWN